MKVIVLTLLTFYSACTVQAATKYELKCTEEELGIRWPSYYSNSEYYVCPQRGGKQVVVTCNPGEVFTFVLQTCGSPSQYIPAPAISALPTSPPIMTPIIPENPDIGMPPIEIQPPTFNPDEDNDNNKPIYPGKPTPPLPPTPAPTPPVANVPFKNTEKPKIPVLPSKIPPVPSKSGKNAGKKPTPPTKGPQKRTPPKPTKKNEKPSPKTVKPKTVQ